MELEQRFTIPTDLEHAWQLLLDVEAVAPCFPGASVTEIDGDEVTGSVKVKLGPVLLTYQGKLRFTERDDSAHRVVMDGRGADAKGNGTASANVTARLEAAGEQATVCHLVTRLSVTGRPAQFGRGMMLEVGNNILERFSDNLAARLSSGDAPLVAAGSTPAAAAASEGRHAAVRPPGTRAATTAEVEPLDLLSAARGAALKRLLPVAVVAVLAVVLLIWWLG